VHAVNRITISDERTEEVIAVYQGEALQLTPQITQSLATNEDNLEFEWIAYDNTSGGSYVQPDTVLSRERNLYFIVTDPPFTLGQTYRVRFAATDKTTGLTQYLGY